MRFGKNGNGQWLRRRGCYTSRPRRNFDESRLVPASSSRNGNMAVRNTATMVYDRNGWGGRKKRQERDQERTVSRVYMVICKRDYFRMRVTGWHFGRRHLPPTPDPDVLFAWGRVTDAAGENTKRKQIEGRKRTRRGKTPRNDRVDSAPLLTRSPRISMVRFSRCCCYMTPVVV